MPPKPPKRAKGPVPTDTIVKGSKRLKTKLILIETMAVGLRDGGYPEVKADVYDLMMEADTALEKLRRRLARI